MATENIIPELSWICALLFLIVIVMLITTCVCFKDHERSPEYGTAGRLSITRDSPIVQYQPKNGGTISMISRQSDASLEDGNLKRNSWTVKDRALPEIPNSTTNSIVSNHSVISDNGQCNTMGAATERVKVKSHNKALAPKPPGSDPSKVFPLNGSALLASEGASGVTVTITVNDVPQVIGNSVPVSESNSKSRSLLAATVPGTSNSTVVLKKIEKVENVDNSARQSTSCEASLYDTVADNVRDRSSQTSASSSPVRIQIGNPIEPSQEGSTSSPSASLAVAGAVPSSDIPYMTPPLLHNPPTMSAVDQVEESTIAGDRSEVPYNVISVREPLARVREKILRKQRTPVHQNSDVSEDHYAVPEEEQMYAEIGSGHDSGSSSITYAHIEPRELPPVPPTVESLKSVAHAHSRQASSVSTSSFGSCISNPGEPSSPPVLRNPSTSLYSTVEKSNKQRKTIHIAEGASLVTTAEKRKKVEDLYAKVRKKRVDMTINISDSDDYFSHPSHISFSAEGPECMTPPPSPWASTTPPAPPPIAGRLQAASLGVLLPSHSQHIRRHSADPNLSDIINENNRLFCGSTHSSLSVSNKDVEEPDYERIYNEENNSGDSCYEKIKEEASAMDTETGYDGFHHSDVNHQRDANYPGYEIVKDSVEDDDSLDPGYECVAQSTSENDPGYEPVRVVGNFEDSDSNSDYTVVKLDDSREPDYERVKKVHRSESDAADPGYEKIKKVLRTGSDATDPGYERVQNKSSDIVDHSYETVQRSDSDTDPGYERVHKDHDSSNGHSDQNYKNFNSQSLPIHTANSTVLFVSGKSEKSKQDICDGDYDKTSSSSITSLTSL